MPGLTRVSSGEALLGKQKARGLSSSQSGDGGGGGALSNSSDDHSDIVVGGKRLSSEPSSPEKEKAKEPARTSIREDDDLSKLRAAAADIPHLSLEEEKRASVMEEGNQRTQGEE